MKGQASIGVRAGAVGSAGRREEFSESTLGASARAFLDKALLSPLVSAGRNGLVGQPVKRLPGELRLHPAINELNLAGWLINSELQGKSEDIHEPILITRSGILFAGFAEWHAGVCAGQAETHCVEFELNADEALQLI